MVEVDSLISELQSYYPQADVALIDRAYAYSKKNAHGTDAEVG